MTTTNALTALALTGLLLLIEEIGIDQVILVLMFLWQIITGGAA